MNKKKMKLLNSLCFRLSVLFLLAAAGCGAVRRFGLTEIPAVVAVWILPVATAAAVGYLTNWLAIQLLFRPYRERIVLGIRFQGLIPKRKATLADTLAELIPDRLMPADRLMFKIRRAIRETMKDPVLAERLHGMVAEYIRDDRRKQALARQLSAFLDTAGAMGVEAGLTPSNVRGFYHSYGAAFVREKVIRNNALRANILDALKEQLPDLIREIRTMMPELIQEYTLDNPLRGIALAIFTGRNGEDLPWQEMERTIAEKLSGRDADRMVEQKLAEFESRLERYLVSPGFEADIAALKQDRAISDTFKAMRDDLAGKLLEFLEDEVVWRIVRTQILPGVRYFLQVQILRNRDAIVGGLDLPGSIRRSINELTPESIHEMVEDVSDEELGMIQLLGFVLGGLAGILLACAL